MNKQLKEIIYRDQHFVNYKDYLTKSFLFSEVRDCIVYRKASYYNKSKNFLIKSYWKMRWLRVRKKNKCQISLKANIGEGLRFLHDGPRIINEHAIIGKDCLMGINVVVGLAKTDKGVSLFPIIGDRVYIGHNSTIVGGIHVGNDVLISPNAFVNKDIPDNSMVIGNNIIIPKKEASKLYLKLGL